MQRSTAHRSARTPISGLPIYIAVALFIVTLSSLVTGCKEDGVVADMILRNGKIVTLDENIPEGSAIAVKDGRILEVGNEIAIGKFAGRGTQIVDLDGKLAVPGLIEGHGHFLGLGDAKLILDLSTPGTWDEIVDMVADAASDAEPGEWITGRGWHQDKWSETPDETYEGFPVHRSLSAVSPDNPVVLRHASGHASIVNQKAMELARISGETPDPQGGEILRGADGRPTGMLRETAQGLVRRPPPETAEEIEALNRQRAQLAADEALRNGITSFHDAGVDFEDIDLFKALADEGSLPVRLYVMIREPNEVLAEKLDDYRTIGYGDNHLTVRTIKLSIDGALGPRGAWLLEPYSDAPHLSGLNLIPIPEVEETARLALRHNYQLAVHAIGDRANREVLDIYEDTFATRPGSDTLRWRIEHAQHISEEDIPRFGRLGVIASMQGNHCTSDASWVPDRLGDERSEEGAYVWQKLMDTGAVVTNGTDVPVEKINPIASLYAAAARRLADGSVFYPEQRMSREEALASYTINNAIAAFEEDIKGTLTPGKLADITVLTKDFMTIDEAEIPDTEVAMTIVGGRILYERDAD